MYRQIEALANQLKEQTIQWRRQFHQIPETAKEEFKTTKGIADILQSLDYMVTTGPAVAGYETGVVAEMKLGEGPLLALRFDIDGLPNEECHLKEHLPNMEGFRSTHPGRMHGCGHDGHIAIGLTCAAILSRLRDQFHGSIRLLFQPGEEGCRGAIPMTANGWLDHVDYFLAGHIVGDEYGAEGSCDCTAVSHSLATTKMNVRFHGHACHGATPEKGISAITTMASAITAMNGIPRHSEGATMLNIGRIEAGEGRNIVAANGYMEMEVRGATTELNQYMEDQVLNILKAAECMNGCRTEVEILGKTPSLESSIPLVQKLYDSWSALKALHPNPSMTRFRASEDAAVMMEHVKKEGGQAVYLLFPTKTTAPLHSVNYDFDESVLTKAVVYFCSAAKTLLA